MHGRRVLAGAWPLNMITLPRRRPFDEFLAAPLQQLAQGDLPQSGELLDKVSFQRQGYLLGNTTGSPSGSETISSIGQQLPETVDDKPNVGG